VKHPGEAYAIPNKKIVFKVEGRWLYMRLPSGRRIAYLDPEMEKVKGWRVNAAGEQVPAMVEGRSVTYMGIDTYTRKWCRVATYGGKLLQNACEGIGRDLLVSGMFNMEKAGYPTVLTVHDEAVFEVPERFGSDEEAMRLMTVPLAWAEGLPVKCEGWRAKRYRK
jgi:DNA polymerase